MLINALFSIVSREVLDAEDEKVRYAPGAAGEASTAGG
jgi:hypothetical protein